MTQFVGGPAPGEWLVVRASAIVGEPLAPVASVTRTEDVATGTWVLRGVRSNHRYTTRDEAARLAAIQAELDRPSCTCAALIPIRKSAAWWQLAQDERRAIFEDSSRHIAIGLRYLPAVARRLYHARDLGEPFDFLTWFEYAADDEPAFEDLVAQLRATEEWRYVEREVDLRLMRSASQG